MRHMKREGKVVIGTVSGQVMATSGGSASSGQFTPEDDRGTWSNQCEFILSCLGFAVGFGNVWRFPYLCYKNGGAVFLIPYFTMLFCAGLPMFFMELVLGQYTSLGPNKVFPNMVPLFSGLGLAMPLVSFYVSVYFAVIIAWSLYYVFSSFTAELPWSTCDHDFNSPECATTDEVRGCQENANYNDTGTDSGNDTITRLFYYNGTCLNQSEMCNVGGYSVFENDSCVNNGTGSVLSPAQAVGRLSSSEDFYRNGVLGVGDATFEHMGTMQWRLVGCMALGWVLVGAAVAKGVKSTGKAIYFTALFPYVVLTVLLVVGLTLEGAQEGIDFYFLKPNASKLADVDVWTDAASQIFFSLGSSFGSLITLASYSKFTTNCMRDAIIISICNCLTSVYAGFALFAILGSLAHDLGVPVSEVVSSGSGLAFVAYPQAVLGMKPPQLWAVIFFCMFITLGMSSQFAMVETVNTALYDQWPSLRKRKPLVVLCICGLMFLLGMPMCLQGGVFLFEMLNLYSAGLSVILLGTIEVVLVHYVYGHRRFLSHIEKEIGIWIPGPLRLYWKTTWLLVTPVSLLLVFIMSVVFWVPAYWGDYQLPPVAQTLGWLTCSSSLAFIPIMAVVVIIKGEHRGSGLMRPTPLLCPAHERARLQRQSMTNTTERYSSLTLERKHSEPAKTDMKAEQVTSF